MSTAQTILGQLGGVGRLSAMAGAHTFLDHGDGVSFKIKGSRAANYIEIKLSALDLYDVKIGKIRKYELTKTQEFAGVFASSLKGLIESTTGLYLTI